jgi:predicted short-subunit dehydrogenase-like oxidoreductase (DUF2520 family)
MRELERDLVPTPTPESPIVVIGRGRVGASLAAAIADREIPVRTAAGTDVADAASGATAVLLCVPDGAVADVCADSAAADPLPKLIGHVSGAGTLELLASASARGVAAFSLHPLQTFTRARTDVAGVPAAVAGSDQAAERFAAALADRLGMRPFSVPESSRAAYHAAASIASNFLVALEESAAGLLAELGIDDGRELLAPLVLRTAANWTEGGGDALTGPIARGDQATVERHRAALDEAAPELLPLYEALAERTAALATSEVRA